MTSPQAAWAVCRDEKHGFTLRYPRDWKTAGPQGRCVRFQRGDPTRPEGVPEVDVSLRVLPVEGEFPSDYLRTDQPPERQKLQVGRGVAYTDRRELLIGNLQAVRARFQSTGPNPNWGVEYAVRKAAHILDAYISQPSPEVEQEFDQFMRSLEW